MELNMEQFEQVMNLGEDFENLWSIEEIYEFVNANNDAVAALKNNMDRYKDLIIKLSNYKKSLKESIKFEEDAEEETEELADSTEKLSNNYKEASDDIKEFTKSTKEMNKVLRETGKLAPKALSVLKEINDANMEKAEEGIMTVSLAFYDYLDAIKLVNKELKDTMDMSAKIGKGGIPKFERPSSSSGEEKAPKKDKGGEQKQSKADKEAAKAEEQAKKEREKELKSRSDTIANAINSSIGEISNMFISMSKTEDLAANNAKNLLVVTGKIGAEWLKDTKLGLKAADVWGKINTKIAPFITKFGPALIKIGGVAALAAAAFGAAALAGKSAYDRNIELNRSLMAMGATSSELTKSTMDTNNQLIGIKNTWTRIGNDLAQIFKPFYEILIDVIDAVGKFVESITGPLSDALGEEDKQKKYSTTDSKARWYTKDLEEKTGEPESKSLPTIGDIASSAKQSGFDNKSAANLGIGTYDTAMKLAKEYGQEASEVAKKLADAWLKGSDAAKEYGIVVDDQVLAGFMASKGVDIVNTQITDAMKQYYRYQLMQEEAANSNSDAMQDLIKEWKQLGAVIDKTKNKLFSFDEVINLEAFDPTIPEVETPDVDYGGSIGEKPEPDKGENPEIDIDTDTTDNIQEALAKIIEQLKLITDILSNLKIDIGDVNIKIEENTQLTIENNTEIKNNTDIRNENNTSIENNTEIQTGNNDKIKENTESLVDNSEKIKENADTRNESNNALDINTGSQGINKDAIDSNTGSLDTNTTAVGGNTTARDTNSTSTDTNTTARENNSTATDINTDSVNNNSDAFDRNNQSINDNTTALDNNTAARENNNISTDTNTGSVGLNSSEVDNNTRAQTENSTAVDENTMIRDASNESLNNNTIARGENTIAVDENTQSTIGNSLEVDNNSNLRNLNTTETELNTISQLTNNIALNLQNDMLGNVNTRMGELTTLLVLATALNAGFSLATDISSTSLENLDTKLQNATESTNNMNNSMLISTAVMSGATIMGNILNNVLGNTVQIEEAAAIITDIYNNTLSTTITSELVLAQQIDLCNQIVEESIDVLERVQDEIADYNQAQSEAATSTIISIANIMTAIANWMGVNSLLKTSIEEVISTMQDSDTQAGLSVEADNDLGKAIEDLQNKVDKCNDMLDLMTEKNETLQGAVQDSTKFMGEEKTAINELDTSAKKFSGTMNSVGQKMSDFADYSEDANEAIEDLEILESRAADNANKLKTQLGEVKSVLQYASDFANGLAKGLDAMAKSAEKAENKLKGVFNYKEALSRLGFDVTGSIDFNTTSTTNYKNNVTTSSSNTGLGGSAIDKDTQKSIKDIASNTKDIARAEEKISDNTKNNLDATKNVANNTKSNNEIRSDIADIGFEFGDWVDAWRVKIIERDEKEGKDSSNVEVMAEAIVMAMKTFPTGFLGGALSTGETMSNTSMGEIADNGLGGVFSGILKNTVFGGLEGLSDIISTIGLGEYLLTGDTKLTGGLGDLVGKGMDWAENKGGVSKWEDKEYKGWNDYWERWMAMGSGVGSQLLGNVAGLSIPIIGEPIGSAVGGLAGAGIGALLGLFGGTYDYINSDDFKKINGIPTEKDLYGVDDTVYKDRKDDPFYQQPDDYMNSLRDEAYKNSSGFASGGIGTKEISNAKLFEGNKKEAVIPLETREGVDYLANAMEQAGASGGSGTNIELHLTLEGIFDTDDRGKWERLAERLAETIDVQVQRRGSLGYGASY